MMDFLLSNKFLESKIIFGSSVFFFKENNRGFRGFAMGALSVSSSMPACENFKVITKERWQMLAPHLFF